MLHTELFRRYPATIVYLTPNDGGGEPVGADAGGRRGRPRPRPAPRVPVLQRHADARAGVLRLRRAAVGRDGPLAGARGAAARATASAIRRRRIRTPRRAPTSWPGGRPRSPPRVATFAEATFAAPTASSSGTCCDRLPRRARHGTDSPRRAGTVAAAARAVAELATIPGWLCVGAAGAARPTASSSARPRGPRELLDELDADPPRDRRRSTPSSTRSTAPQAASFRLFLEWSALAGVGARRGDAARPAGTRPATAVPRRRSRR